MTEELSDHGMSISERITALRVDLEALVSGASNKSVQEIKTKLTALIAALDRRLSAQIDRILHHEEFQQLEGVWRGLYYLVNQTGTGGALKIKVLVISKKELQKTLKRYKGYARERGPLFIKLHREPYTSEGSEPFGCLLGDFHFGPCPQDVEILSELAEICRASHFPFLGGGAASIVGFEAWQDLGKLSRPELSRRFRTEPVPPSKYPTWHNLRRSDSSRYLYLTAPRCLARLPYGARDEPVDAFDFEERVNRSMTDHKQYTWINSAYAMGAIVHRAFERYSWCARIRRGWENENDGMTEQLPATRVPFVSFIDDEDTKGVADKKCHAEIAISPGGGLAETLAGNGLLPLEAHPYIESEETYCWWPKSVHKPYECDDPDKTVHRVLSSWLNYLLPACRFAQYLQCIVRDNIERYMDRQDMQNHLAQWVRQYVHDTPERNTLLRDYKQRRSNVDPSVRADLEKEIETIEASLARQPLAEASILVEEIEGVDDYYRAKLLLLPIYQLDDLVWPMRLAMRLPAVRRT